MKRFISALISSVGAIVLVAASKPEVAKIEPPYWWTGMTNDTVQLLISGPEIASANMSVDYKGVKIVDDVATDSPNYKIVYLTIADDAEPGQLNLDFVGRDGRLTVPYTLKERTWSGEDNPGFDARDVLYLIMPDRFADGDTVNNSVAMRYPYRTDRSANHSRHGGDIRGMLDRLDYIDSLGVTAVWVNPVLENDTRGGSYHGYSTTDYYRIDPRFGSNEEWADFVKACHDRGIKVVMDMIFNHTGHTHPWMADMPMKDWYNHPQGDVMTNFRLSTIHDPYASDVDLDATVNGWFVRSMPDLNQRNKHLMNYLIQNSIFWIEDSKIDGIRMDTYPYADAQAMARWISEVEREYPAFNIVGECWYPSEGGEAFWQRGSRVNPVDPNLPTVMDFQLALSCRDGFNGKGDGTEGLNKIYEHLALDYLFPEPQRILTFFDNHDTDRFLESEPTDLRPWKQAMTFLLTSRGIPQIYYGTEILMNGTRAEGGDGNIRRDMPGGFPGDELNVFDGSGMTPLQAEAFDFMSRLLHWRKGEANDVIAKGALKHFIPHGDVYVYERRLGDKSVVVILNGNDEETVIETLRFAEVLPPGTDLTDITDGSQVTVGEEITLSPRQTMILTNF